jgi:predicted ester cyclase
MSCTDGAGKHTDVFMGIPPTGKTVSVRVASFERFVHGKSVSSEVFMDLFSLLVQLNQFELPKKL